MTRLLPAVLLSAAFLFAPDVATGTWNIAGDVQGVGISEVCSLVQTDANIAGSCDGMGKKYPATGAVDGKKVTFSHGGEYEGQALTLTFSGTLADDGSLQGSIDVDPLNVSGVFTAKKAAAKVPEP